MVSMFTKKARACYAVQERGCIRCDTLFLLRVVSPGQNLGTRNETLFTDLVARH